jgi:hypothetical protein
MATALFGGGVLSASFKLFGRLAQGDLKDSRRYRSQPPTVSPLPPKQVSERTKKTLREVAFAPGRLFLRI